MAVIAAGLVSALTAAAPAADHVTVVMVDDRFQPDHVVFRAGRPTELRLENRGKEMHEFTAPGFLHAATIKDKRALSNGGGDIVVRAGRTVRVTLVPGPAGEYPLECADHDWNGMTGSISVVQ
jgi:plastocyanin